MSDDNSEIIDPKTAGKLIKKSADWLYRQRKDGSDAPPHHVLGGRYFYVRTEVLNWLGSHGITVGAVTLEMR